MDSVSCASKHFIGCCWFRGLAGVDGYACMVPTMRAKSAFVDIVDRYSSAQSVASTLCPIVLYNRAIVLSR